MGAEAGAEAGAQAEAQAEAAAQAAEAVEAVEAAEAEKAEAEEAGKLEDTLNRSCGAHLPHKQILHEGSASDTSDTTRKRASRKWCLELF